MNIITMKYHLKQLFVLLLIICSFTAFTDNRLSESEADTILNDISETLDTVSTLQADFRQERTLWVFDDTLVTEGICYFEDPDRLRWEINEPFNTVLIYNEGDIAKFEKSNGDLVKYNLGTEEIMRIILSEIIYWMKGDFEQAKELYDLSVIDNSNYIIELVPKSDQMKNIILKIELEISRSTKHILSVSIFETHNDTIKIKFTNEVNNIRFNENLFNTESPSY